MATPLNADPRILLTNDDGIRAPGLKSLVKIAQELTSDLWIVAPESNQSAVSRALTMSRPLRIYQHDEKQFSADGTPADCMQLAMRGLLPDDKPVDLVLSGVNLGANLAENIFYSGTLAAAMESTILGARAIALSQSFSDNIETPFHIAEEHAPRIVRRLYEQDWPPGGFLSVNFPDCQPHAVTDAVITCQGTRAAMPQKLVSHLNPRGIPYVWCGPQEYGESTDTESDCHAVEQNRISITPMRLDLTHGDWLDSLRGAWSSRDDD